jgi:hypothetical protein
LLTPGINDPEYSAVVKPAIPLPSYPPKEKTRDYPALIELIKLKLKKYRWSAVQKDSKTIH